MSQFKVGQQVIAVRNSDDGSFKKGDIRIVVKITSCPNCRRVKLAFGGYVASNTHCSYCKCTYGFDGTDWFKSESWVPLQDNFQKIRYERVLAQVEVGAN